MTKDDLIKKLLEYNIPKDSYSLDGGLPNEAYCLNRSENTWEVYYSERGQKSGIKCFNTEDEACDYFFESLYCMLDSMDIL